MEALPTPSHDHNLPSARSISRTRVEAFTAWWSRWAKADEHTTPPSGIIAVVLPPSPSVVVGHKGKQRHGEEGKRQGYGRW